MAKKPPEPRPALRRAADADLHPVSGRTPPSTRIGGNSLRPGKGGPTTSDALTGSAKDKLVDLGVRIPKSLRKEMRARAKEEGVSVDELTATLLATALGHRGRLSR